MKFSRNNKYKVSLEKTFLEHFNDLDELKPCQMDFIGDIHLIKNFEGHIVGVIDYRVFSSASEVYIEKIETLEKYKKQGYATETIRMLKDMYPNYKIIGQSVTNETTKNIWINIGATFGSCSDAECPYNSFDECRHPCDNPADYEFCI